MASRHFAHTHTRTNKINNYAKCSLHSFRTRIVHLTNGPQQMVSMCPGTHKRHPICAVHSQSVECGSCRFPFLRECPRRHQSYYVRAQTTFVSKRICKIDQLISIHSSWGHNTEDLRCWPRCIGRNDSPIAICILFFHGEICLFVL